MKMMKNIKRSIWCLSIVLAASLVVPMVAFASGTSNNLVLEYRFAEGESVSVTDVVTQFGISYRLVSQTAPVLESTLPVTRDHTYRIDGVLTADDYAQLAGIPGLTLTPVLQYATRKLDKEFTLNGLPNNDVNSLLASTQYLTAVNNIKAANATYIEGPELTGVTFTETKWELGILPVEYSADVIVRGVERFQVIGYYLASMSYTSSTLESELPIYIIFATYEPINPPPELDYELEEPSDDDEYLLPVSSDYFAGLTNSDLERMGNQTGNPFVDLFDGNVPLGNANVKAGVSLISALLSIIAIILFVVHILALRANRQRKDDVLEYVADEEQAQNERRRKNSFIMLICFVSALVPVVWLSLDNLLLPFVWMNAWTVLVGVCFIVDVILIGLYKIRYRVIDAEERVDYAL